jgi:hypothetical protein
MKWSMTRRHVPALVAALAALMAVPASAHATEPWADLCADEDMMLLVPKDGVPHAFDASCTFDADGHDIVDYEWDFDGDGHFETSTGATPAALHVFSSRGAYVDATVNFALRVTDAAGEVGTAEIPLRIRDELNSWFNFSPQIVNPGDQIDLKGSIAPEDPDGGPFTYEWDLDGNGAFERTTTDARTSFPAPDVLGKQPVSLRVSDSLGNQSVVKRLVEIVPRHPSRDQQPWAAPVNLQNTPVLDLQNKELHEAIAAPGDAVAPAQVPGDEQAPGTDTAAIVRIRAIRARFGMRAARVTFEGPAGHRFRATLRLSPKVAKALGFGRRYVVLGRGAGRLGPGGTKTITVRWNAAGRRAHLSKPHLVQIVSRLV